MYAYFTFLAFTTLTRIIFGCEHYHDPACQDVEPIDGDHFMNQFIAEIEGGEEVAKKVARDIGFKYKKPMKTHKNHYFFTHAEVYARHKNRHEDVLKILREHDDVKVADQQYVWRPTISELESYEDMVGLEEPHHVTTSHFHPDEIEIEGRSAWELIRPDDVFVEPEPIQDYPPIHTLVDFEKLYAEKNLEKEKRAQERHLQEELQKKLEEERLSAETPATSDSVLQNENTEEPESVDTAQVSENKKIYAGEKPEPIPQDEETNQVEKPEYVNDKQVLKDEKIDEDGKPTSTGDGKVLENAKISEKNGSEIEGNPTEESETNETRSEADDEATVETYEE